jgi:hypothetical protein
MACNNLLKLRTIFTDSYTICYSLLHSCRRPVGMLSSWLTSLFPPKQRNPYWFPLVRNYRALSSATVDQLWQQVANLADVSWHPLLTSTDLPYGLVPKPGLIYQAVMRMAGWIPFPVQIFVERVNPGEFLSIRILAIPGVEERVTYRVDSTVLGTCISCSINLRGCLAPLLWSLIHPAAAKLAEALASAAEQAALMPTGSKPPKDSVFDF